MAQKRNWEIPGWPSPTDSDVNKNVVSSETAISLPSVCCLSKCSLILLWPGDGTNQLSSFKQLSRHVLSKEHVRG